MKRILALLAIVAVVMAGCGEATTTAPAKQDFSLMPVEQQFVTVAKRASVDLSDPAVKRAKELIDRAAKEYGMDRQAVADQAFKAYTIARDQGMNVTAEEVLEAATLSHVRGDSSSFAEHCAMYLTLRKSGQAHAESMLGMKGLISRLVEIGKGAK